MVKFWHVPRPSQMDAGVTWTFGVMLKLQVATADRSVPFLSGTLGPAEASLSDQEHDWPG